MSTSTTSPTSTATTGPAATGPAAFTSPTSAELLAAGLHAIVHGRRMPEALRPADPALPRFATVAEGCAAILRLR